MNDTCGACVCGTRATRGAFWCGGWAELDFLDGAPWLIHPILFGLLVSKTNRFLQGHHWEMDQILHVPCVNGPLADQGPPGIHPHPLYSIYQVFRCSLVAKASLQGTKGIATRSKDATRGASGLTTRNKKLLGARTLSWKLCDLARSQCRLKQGLCHNMSQLP